MKLGGWMVMAWDGSDDRADVMDVQRRFQMDDL